MITNIVSDAKVQTPGEIHQLSSQMKFKYICRPNTLVSSLRYPFKQVNAATPSVYMR